MINKEVYEIEDIQEKLGIGRTSAYTYIKGVYDMQFPFRVIKIGRVYRIPKQDFDEYISGKYVKEREI